MPPQNFVTGIRACGRNEHPYLKANSSRRLSIPNRNLRPKINIFTVFPRRLGLDNSSLTLHATKTPLPNIRLRLSLGRIKDIPPTRLGWVGDHIVAVTW